MKLVIINTSKKSTLKDLHGGQIFIIDSTAHNKGELASYFVKCMSDNKILSLLTGAVTQQIETLPVIPVDCELHILN